MALTITKEQRDALYDQIVDRLNGIGDVWLAVCARDYEAAQRLARDYSDDLRLVVDDLGWADGPAEPIELTTPPDVLRRVFGRLYDAAASHSAGLQHEWAEVGEMRRRNRLVTEVCQSILVELDR
jgi:hypothetical protein